MSYSKIVDTLANCILVLAIYIRSNGSLNSVNPNMAGKSGPNSIDYINFDTKYFLNVVSLFSHAVSGAPPSISPFCLIASSENVIVCAWDEASKRHLLVPTISSRRFSRPLKCNLILKIFELLAR